MAAEKAGKKPEATSKTSTGDKADKTSGETKAGTPNPDEKAGPVNPEGQKRVTRTYLQGWERIWGKKR